MKGVKMLEVRKAIKEDSIGLAALNCEFNGTNVTQEHIIEIIEKGNEVIAVVLWEKEIIGFACAQYFKSFCSESMFGEVTELYVREQFRKKGVATSLIVLLEKELNLMGVKETKIITNVKNEVARNFYSNKGYGLKNWVVYKKEY